MATIVAGRDSPQKHVWRARIVLLTADGAGTNRSCANKIMRRTGKAKTAVWRWQERFMQANADPPPFCWTKNPGQIIAAAGRGHQALDLLH